MSAERLEIIQRHTAALKRSARLAANLSRVESHVLPEMAEKINAIANAVSGLEKLNDLVKEVQVQYADITLLVSEANDSLADEVDNISEAADDANALEDTLLDDATVIANLDLYLQANPDMLNYVLEHSTLHALHNAIARMTAENPERLDKIREMMTDG